MHDVIHFQKVCVPDVFPFLACVACFACCVFALPLPAHACAPRCLILRFRMLDLRQGRLGLIFFVVLFLSFLCLTSLAAWVKQMHLSRHERAAGVYSARAHLITSYLADAVVCRVLPPIILGITIRPLAGLRYGSLPGLTAVMIVFNLCLAGVLAACGTGARYVQRAFMLTLI